MQRSLLLKTQPETQFGYVNSALSVCTDVGTYIHTYMQMYVYVSASKHVFVVCVALVLPALEVPVPLGCRASYVRLLSLHRMRCEQVCVRVCVRFALS